MLSAHLWPDRGTLGSGVRQAHSPVLAVEGKENHRQHDDHHGDGKTRGGDQDQGSRTSSITPSDGGCGATEPHAQSFARLVLRWQVCVKSGGVARGMRVVFCAHSCEPVETRAATGEGVAAHGVVLG